MSEKITEVRVYWDAQDQDNEGWAVKWFEGEELLGSDAVAAETLGDAIEEVVRILDLPCGTDDFATHREEGGWAIWTRPEESNNDYSILANGNKVATMTANFAQASCPILLDGQSTPFQVADAQHDPGTAAEMLNRWCFSQGGEIWGEDDEVEVVAN